MRRNKNKMRGEEPRDRYTAGSDLKREKNGGDKLKRGRREL